MWGCVVKAPSAWLTYIGSLPLTSHHSSSLTNTGLHTHKDAHTHTLYPSLRRLCSLMLCLLSLSPSFSAPISPSLFISLGIFVWLGTSNISKRRKKTVLCWLRKAKQNKNIFFHSLNSFFLHFTYLKRVLERWCWPGSVAVGVGSEHQEPGPAPDCHCPPPESHAWWPSCSPRGRSWQSWPLRERWPGGKSQPPQL